MKKKLLSMNVLSEFKKLSEVQLSKIVGGYGNSSCSGSGDGCDKTATCCDCPKEKYS